MIGPGSARDPAFWGQLLMVGIPGPQVDEVARKLVRELKVGGIILFARNLQSPEQVWQLTRDLQREALSAAGKPLLIAVDQEGGPVQRLKAPFTAIPSAREMGETSGVSDVEVLGRQVARELRLVGINVNLAPVLDVARGPECPLWERSYGADPELVAVLGVAAIRAWLTGGIIPVAKHFPGLGDTVQDSHVELPQVPAEPSWAVDLLPFQRAVAAGVPAIMTAHLLVPAWDSRPVTLSRKVLQGIIRQKLRFTGIIMTDDLEMGAIAGQAPVPQAAREALAAGADLLLICQDWQGAFEAAQLLTREAALVTQAGAAVNRLLALKKKLTPLTTSLDEVKSYFRISGSGG